MVYNNQNFRRDDSAKRPGTPAPQVNISNLTASLFADQAQKAAQACVAEKENKTTQIRRFYDELVLWYDKVFAVKNSDEQDQRLERALPYIQMLRAKAAYARGRGLINDTFLEMFNHIIQQIQNKDQLKNAKLFMEAFLGYKKNLETK